MERNAQRINAPGNQKPSGMSGVRPRRAVVIAVWALVQVVRITALPIIQGVLAGLDSPAWLFPAFVDMFIGITAPLVAFALWRRTGLAVWVTGIVWFTLSISDHLDAIVAALISPIPLAFFGGNQSGVVTSLLISALLDVVFLVLLTRGKLKSHYLGSLRAADQ
jgi:hypothetical protein